MDWKKLAVQLALFVAAGMIVHKLVGDEKPKCGGGGPDAWRRRQGSGVWAYTPVEKPMAETSQTMPFVMM